MNAQCSHGTLLSPPPAAPAALPGGKRRTPRPLCSNSRGAPCCIVPVHHTHTLTPRRAPSDPSRQLPNFPTSRKAGKPKSWQVGTHHYPPVGQPPPAVSRPRPPHPVSAVPAAHPSPPPLRSHPSSHTPPVNRTLPLAPAGGHHPPARLTRRVDQTKGLPRLTPSKMYNAIVSGRCPAQTATVAQTIKESVRSLQRQHVP